MPRQASAWNGGREQSREEAVDLKLVHEAYARRENVASCLHQACETAATHMPLTVPPVLHVDTIWVGNMSSLWCHNVAHAADLWWRLRLWTLFLLGGFSSVPM